MLFLSVLVLIAGTRQASGSSSNVPAYDLWLGYYNALPPKDRGAPSARRRHMRARENITSVYCDGSGEDHSPLTKACRELSSALTKIFDKEIPQVAVPVAGSVAVSLADGAKDHRKEFLLLNMSSDTSQESYRIQWTACGGNVEQVPCLRLTSPTGRGALYGAFGLISRLQRNKILNIKTVDIVDAGPRSKVRVWQLWDNMDGTVERGYGGRSVFHWEELPGTVRPRYADYARFLASVGINAVSLTNVNACFPRNIKLLTDSNITKAATLASVFASYGIATFMVPCFASPQVVGGLNTSDPLNPQVSQWWKTVTSKIVASFEGANHGNGCFAGYLLKADSEGMSGPSTYNRTEPEGSAVLANAVEGYDGFVLWRAFTHPGNLGPRKIGDQPLMQFEYFKQFDGQWHDHVVLQIKNGPMDFQTHEPVHSLFGGLERTKVMVELGVTQEYTGQAFHVVFLPSQWEHYLSFDTECKQTASKTTLADILTNHSSGYGFAGVSNFGEGSTWTGNPLSAANSYGFGRMSWNPFLSAETVAEEWTDLTWGNDLNVNNPIKNMLLSSWEAYENYTSPLGLSAIDDNCGNSCPFLPNGMKAPRADHYFWAGWLWAGVTKPPNAGYGGGFNFSRTDKAIGNNRSLAYGATYCGTNRAKFAVPKTTPLRLLLTFHHLPLDYTLLDSGRTLHDIILASYTAGLFYARNILKQWASMSHLINSERYIAVLEKLSIGTSDAANFTTTAVAFF